MRPFALEETMSIRIVNLAIDIKRAAERLEVIALTASSAEVNSAAAKIEDLAFQLANAADSEAQADRLRSH